MSTVSYAERYQLCNALRDHDVAKFRELLSGGLDPESKCMFHLGSVDFEPYDVLTHTVKSNFRAGIEILLRERDVTTWFGFTQACRMRNDNVIRLFLRIACERRRCSSEYLLILLAHKIISMAVEFIRMNGFSVDDQTLDLTDNHAWRSLGRNGQSPLHVAALFPEPQLLECLIERGGKLDIKDSDGYTPVYVACTQGTYECCQCLLSHGANPNFNTKKLVRGAGPQSPLSALCKSSVSPANEKFFVGLLLSAGLDMNKERWILDRRRRHNITDETLCLLKSLCRVPCTLEITCVRAIRQHLSELTTGRSIHSRVQGLPVPLLLKTRLIVSDFDYGIWLSTLTV